MIILKDVRKGFSRANGKRLTVFENLNMVIKTTDSIAVMGPKLAGKTTFIRMLTGFVPPDQGTISRYCEISYPVGYTGVLAGNMTGRENIAFIARVFNCDPEKITAFVAYHSELGTVLDRLVTFYSQDERARLAFMLSYAIPFHIYVLDGSVGRGSDAFRQKCAEMLDTRAEQSGVILATGSAQLARRHCKKVLMIEDGTVTLYDDVEEGISHFQLAKSRASAVA